MAVPDFAEHYATLQDEELLLIAADRKSMSADAVFALSAELRKRGLGPRDAANAKRRVDRLTAREREGASVYGEDDVAQQRRERAEMKRERKIRQFEGDFEPEYVPLRNRGLLGFIDYEKYKVRTWQVFRQHTGRWPLISISFHILIVLAMVLGIFYFFWLQHVRGWGAGRASFVGIALIIAYGLIRATGSHYARKLDWLLLGDRRKHSV